MEATSSNHIAPQAFEKEAAMPTLETLAEHNLDVKPNNRKTIGLFKSIFLITRSIIGVGVLAQPHLNDEFGIYPVMICYPLIALFVIYCLMLLPKIADHMDYQGNSLEEFTESILGISHRRLVTGFNLAFCVSVSIVATIFSISFINYAQCQLESEYCNDYKFLHMIVALFLLPLALIHDVSFFVYFAGMCLAIIFVSLGTVSYYMVKLNQKLGPSDDYTTSNWKRFPEFFGIACFSLEGIGLIFPIRGSLKTPSNFRIQFNWIASFMVQIYISFGMLCHISLGGSTKEIIFHNFPKSFKGIFVLQFLFAIGIFTTFPVYIQTTASVIRKIPIMQRFFEGDTEYKNSVFLRACLIVFFFVISQTGINIQDFMSLAGSICNSYQAFILPNLAYIKYYESKNLLSHKSKIFHYILLTIGVCLSLWALIYSIINVYTGHHDERFNMRKIESIFDP